MSMSNGGEPARRPAACCRPPLLCSPGARQPYSRTAVQPCSPASSRGEPAGASQPGGRVELDLSRATGAEASERRGFRASREVAVPAGGGGGGGGAAGRCSGAVRRWWGHGGRFCTVSSLHLHSARTQIPADEWGVQPTRRSADCRRTPTVLRGSSARRRRPAAFSHTPTAGVSYPSGRRPTGIRPQKPTPPRPRAVPPPVPGDIPHHCGRRRGHSSRWPAGADPAERHAMAPSRNGCV